MNNDIYAMWFASIERGLVNWAVERQDSSLILVCLRDNNIYPWCLLNSYIPIANNFGAGWVRRWRPQGAL